MQSAHKGVTVGGAKILKNCSCVPPTPSGLVRLVCGEEGHAVGPEVGVEVGGLVEAPAAHLAAQVAVAVLPLLRGGGGGAQRGALGAAALRLARGVPHPVGDEAVAAERAGRGEADAALQALEGGGVAAVLRDVPLELRPVLRGETAGDAAEDAVLLLQLAGRRRRGQRGSSGPFGGTGSFFWGVFFLHCWVGRGRADLAVLLRRAARPLPPCGCTLPGEGGALRRREAWLTFNVE